MTEKTTTAPIPERGLSIAEPWAHLIAAGFKQLENRTWQTDYRGPTLLHASKSERSINDVDLMYDVWSLHPAIYAAWDDKRITEERQLFQAGAIIGTADIVDCVRYDPQQHDPDDLFGKYKHLTKSGPAPEIPVGAWAEGPVCFVLANPRRFRQPILYRGRLSLWTVPTELKHAVSAINHDILTDPGEPPSPPAQLGPSGKIIPIEITEEDRKEAAKKTRAKARRRKSLLGSQLG